MEKAISVKKTEKTDGTVIHTEAEDMKMSHIKTDKGVVLRLSQRVTTRIFHPKK